MDFLWLFLVIGVVAGLWWLSTLLDPHMVSKDGGRFLCMAESISTDSRDTSRPKEAWVIVLPDGALRIDQKHNLRRRHEYYHVIAKAPPDASRRGRRKAVYLVATRDRSDTLALRIPLTSRVIPTMERLLAESASRGRAPSVKPQATDT